MYIVGAIALFFLVTFAYRKYQETNVANEKAIMDAKLEAAKKKRMLDLQTLHKLKEMGLT